MRALILALISCLRAALIPRAALALENAALRQQLATYLRVSRPPRLGTSDRAFWVVLRRFWPDWTRVARENSIALFLRDLTWTESRQDRRD